MRKLIVFMIDLINCWILARSAELALIVASEKAPVLVQAPALRRPRTSDN
jgi:hypothetical protein